MDRLRSETGDQLRPSRKPIAFGSSRTLITLFAWIPLFSLAVLLAVNRDLVPWATEYPDNRVVPLTVWFGDAVDWLANRFDLGLFTFKEFTRAISNILEWTSVVIEVILLNGASLSIGRANNQRPAGFMAWPCWFCHLPWIAKEGLEAGLDKWLLRSIPRCVRGSGPVAWRP